MSKPISDRPARLSSSPQAAPSSVRYAPHVFTPPPARAAHATHGQASHPAMPGQGGAVLAVSLIMLLLLTLIGITAMNTNSLEEKMAGNMRDRNLALQAAEAAVRAGEATLEIPNPEPAAAPICATPPCACGAPPCDAWAFSAPGNFLILTKVWWDANGRLDANLTTATLGGVKSAPRFVIEARGLIPGGASLGFGNSSGNTGSLAYRVTGRGTGGTDEAQVLIQSSYLRQN